MKHPVTGHQINVDEASAEFWQAAGYRAETKQATKAAAKKASSSKPKK